MKNTIGNIINDMDKAYYLITKLHVEINELFKERSCSSYYEN